MIGAALLALLAQNAEPVCPHHPPESALCNAPGDVPKGAQWDFVPLDPTDCASAGAGFYVLYSRRSFGIEKNVNVFIFPLSGGEALIFGAGYGDLAYQLYSSYCDASWATTILRDELGLDPATAKLHFVAPHGHYDHVNAPFLETLRDEFGWNLVEIAYHADDWCLPSPNPMCSQRWTEASIALFNPLRATAAPAARLIEVNLGRGSYESPLGRITIHHRPGHTPGSVDLILWMDDGQRIMVRGSIPPPNWPDPAFLQDLRAHDNVLLQGRPCGC